MDVDKKYADSAAKKQNLQNFKYQNIPLYFCMPHYYNVYYLWKEWVLLREIFYWTLRDERAGSKTADTLKAYLEKNRLGKYNPEETAKREAEKKREEEAEENAAKSITVGDRCEVSVPGNPTRRAEVMFVGKTQFKPGWWVGVKYDEPMGKNDGSINGVRYFECLPKYGGFIKPMYIKVGDFPEESLDLDDEL